MRPRAVARRKGTRTKKRFVEFLDKSNSESFYRVLKIFYKELINEWVMQGNQAEDFAKKGSKIILVLDNASFHKKAEYLQKIEKEMPNLYLEFLPEYSPDYNLVVVHSNDKLRNIVSRLKYALPSM